MSNSEKLPLPEPERMENERTSIWTDRAKMILGCGGKTPEEQVRAVCALIEVYESDIRAKDAAHAAELEAMKHDLSVVHKGNASLSEWITLDKKQIAELQAENERLQMKLNTAKTAIKISDESLERVKAERDGYQIAFELKSVEHDQCHGSANEGWNKVSALKLQVTRLREALEYVRKRRRELQINEIHLTSISTTEEEEIQIIYDALKESEGT